MDIRRLPNRIWNPGLFDDSSCLKGMAYKL